MISSYQSQVYMRARETGCTQVQSATIAGFSERSGRRIEAGEHQPQADSPREWRTRVDPLAEVWDSELEPMLRREPRLEPRTLFDYLVGKYPGQYESVLRTLQRRVQAWKAIYGAPKEVMFELRHEPGEMGLSDFTELKGITITIGGKPFEHILYHYRLAYSGWQYVEIIQGGESFIGLSQGLQNALRTCGGVPKLHRTDSLSAAYRNMAGKRRKPLTRLYDELCDHYRMQPTRNNTGIAHENGSIESPHGHFKRRLLQQLYLRGSFEFDCVATYAQLIHQVVETLNARCTSKFADEQQHLQPLPTHRVADYEELSVRVSCHSAIEVRCILYSVPARLIGTQLTIHLYHDRLVGYLGRTEVVRLARIRATEPAKSRRARCIDYRHIIAGLKRKPRAFLYCTWQQEILPTDQWRALWQQMGTQFDPDTAAKVMVEALYIAATQDKETAVAEYLQAHLHQQTLTLTGLQRDFQLLKAATLPTLNVQQHELSPYDQLLNTTNEPTAPAALPESQPTPQTTAIVPYAHPVADPGVQSNPGAVVLQPILAGALRVGGQSPLPGAPTTGTGRSPTAERKKFYQL